MASNQDYSILAKVVLDLSDIQQQLNRATFSFNNTSIKGTANVLDDAADSASNLGDAMNGTQLTFQAANAIFSKTIDIISTLSEQVLTLDKSLTEFKKVSDLSGDSLDDYVQQLSNLGTTVARTASEMVDAATEFKKSGFTEAESANLAQIASLYQNIADEELSAGEAANFIISQMKAFNLTVDDSLHIVDAVY